jgi:hypothetical protein
MRSTLWRGMTSLKATHRGPWLANSSLSQSQSLWMLSRSFQAGQVPIASQASRANVLYQFPTTQFRTQHRSTRNRQRWGKLAIIFRRLFYSGRSPLVTSRIQRRPWRSMVGDTCQLLTRKSFWLGSDCLVWAGRGQIKSTLYWMWTKCAVFSLRFLGRWG